MREDFCASILQLDPSIRSVTRTTDTFLENAQRCRYEGDSAYADEESNETMFRIMNRNDGYQYELTGNASHCQLRIPINDNIIYVVINGMQVDIPSLAQNIVKLARIQQNPEVVTQLEYPVNCAVEARTG